MERLVAEWKEGKMFYLSTHSTLFNYGYMASVVVSSYPVRGQSEKRGCSGHTPTNLAFKNLLCVGAGTEMRTQYLPAH